MQMVTYTNTGVDHNVDTYQQIKQNTLYQTENIATLTCENDLQVKQFAQWTTCYIYVHETYFVPVHDILKTREIQVVFGDVLQLSSSTF